MLNFDEDIKNKAKTLPITSGVYIYKGEHGEVLYVGKAKILRRRVLQYFNESVLATKTLALRSKIRDLNYVVTPSELDALVLENNLIKRYRPPYNILLKDDKTYPYIKINMKEDFPSIEVTRVLRRDGSRYFGPYMLGISASAIMDVIHYAFPIRSCHRDLSKRSEVCLDYHLERCLAPCARKCGKTEYREMLDGVIKFLNGDDKSVEEELERRMKEASDEENFELAKEYRDRLKILSSLVRRQVAEFPRDLNVDVFGVYGDALGAVVNVLMVRGGKILGSDNIPVLDNSPSTISQFLIQYYDNNPLLADALISTVFPDFSKQIVDYLKEKYGKKVGFISSTAPIYKALRDMSVNNAKEYMDKNSAAIETHKEMTIKAVEDLERILGLSRLPLRMECFDISHVSGTNKVASMVVFKSGVKAGEHYRKFKIRSVVGNNDFASMRETLTRRVAKIGVSDDISFGEKPDLIVIDGGRGQLSAVEDVIPDDIDVIALAESYEDIYIRGGPQTPLHLPKSNNALRLLQRLRDEAHRFAITFHRSLRAKAQTSSELVKIDGVGEVTARKLFSVYKNLETIATTEIDDFIKDGFGKKVAENVYRHFHD